MPAAGILLFIDPRLNTLTYRPDHPVFAE